MELLYFTRPYLHCALTWASFHSVVFQWAVYAVCCSIGNVGSGRTEVAATFIANRSTILCATYVRETHILCDKPSSIQLINPACRNVLSTLLCLAIRIILITVLLAPCLQLCGVKSRQTYISQFNGRNCDIHLFRYYSFSFSSYLHHLFLYFAFFFVSSLFPRVQYNLRL